MPNFVSVAPSIAELARGEKSCIQSITQSLSLPAYLMRREPKQFNNMDDVNIVS